MSPGSTDEKASAQSPGLTLAAQQLVAEHQWIVQKVARRILREVPRVAYTDLVSWGHVALTEWAASFDPSRDRLFERTASARVEWAMRDGARGERRYQRTFAAADLSGAEYACALEDEPAHAHADSQRQAVTDEAFGLIGARLLGLASAIERLDPEQAIIARQESKTALELLEKALGELPQRDQELLRLKYDHDMEIRDVSRLLNPTPKYSTATRMHREALIRLGTRLRVLGLRRPGRGASRGAAK